MEEGLLVVRLDGSVQAFDSVAERLLGLAAGSLRIGAVLTDLIDWAELSQLLSQGHERSSDGRMRFADLPVSSSGRLLVLHWTSLSDSVAEAPSLLLKIRGPEAAAETEASRSLVSRLSRELRAPVAAIRGCSATLLGGALDELDRARRFVEMVQHNAAQLEEIADDLSALAQVERTWIEKRCIAVEAYSLLAAITHRLAEEGIRRGVALRAAVAERRLVVAAVPQLLEQSLLGILSELLRAAKSGDEITCEILLGDGEDAAQITMRRRGRNAVEGREPAVTGGDEEAGSIRLATVRDVVRGHGGRVRFASSSGRLEAVRLHWPLWRDQAGGKLECYDRVTAVKFA
jgi:signal transduction histidine kinase